MRKIFCFGNEYISGDEVAIELGRKLKVEGFEFVIVDNGFTEILNFSGDELVVMDVIIGIDEVKLLEDAKSLELSYSVTCHDLDLGFFLKLLERTGMVKKIKIIGLPYGNSDYESLEKGVKKVLGKL